MATPIYIIEEKKLRRNLRLISDVAAKADIEIILAFKAFALWKTFPIFREYIHATTASSLSEARLALEEFGAPAHTYSPAYTDDEIDEIIRCSSHLTFNSLSQYQRYHERATGVSLGLRVNPEYSEVGTLLYNPCAPGTRFGVMADQLPEQLPEDIEGFHCHCHCESGADVFQRTLVHIEAKFAKWFPQLKWINFGGGHLMTRKDYDVDLLIRMMHDFHQRYPWLKVILEPGSAFAWQTGPLVSHVVDIVENKGIKTAILDVSFTCHMPDCLEMPYFPDVRGAEHVEESSDYPESSDYRYRLGGNSCLSGDFMGSWQFGHELAIGEEVIFEDMIHYTTVKTNTFNGVTHPSLAMLHEDGTLEILRRFGYEDYRNRMD
jgi:carboxynorspermidine decarboxylase